MHPRAYLASLEPFGVRLGLDQIRAVLAALDHPERSRPAITIAGTNGKGSVTAMVERGLRAAGWHTGRYTSPHLIDLEERFAIDGLAVAPPDLDDALAEVERAARQLPAPPTYFEATTAAALLLFRRADVDVSLLEVGLGGRLDATNAVDAAAVVVTAIDLDHQELLGPTIETIAREKAAVIKANSLVVMADNPPAAAGAVRDRCRQTGATLIEARAGVELRATMIDGRARLELATPCRRYAPLTLGLRGRHQVANALTAIRMLESLDARGLFRVPEPAVRTAVEEVDWPGRLESLDVQGTAVLVDGAHNAAGATALAGFLRETFARPLPIVLGVLRDKDVEAVVAALAGAAARVVCTAPPSPRATPPEELASVVGRLAPGVPVERADSPAHAIELAGRSGEPVVVAGSLYLAGAVRALATRHHPGAR